MFKKLRYALGLSSEAEDDDLIKDDPDTLSRERLGASWESDTAPDSVAMENRIFNHVVEVFNKSLPGFLASSVNPAAQSKYLFDTLDADLKDYLNNLAQAASQKSEKSWQLERGQMQQHVAELQKQLNDTQSRYNELNQRQLSTDRQRRALSDRVHALEKQVVDLEAEKEQYQLESKSLVNKLKVSGVHQEENDQLQKEIAELRAQLVKAREEHASGNPVEVPQQADPEELEGVRKDLQAVREEHEKTLAQLDYVNHQLDEAHQRLENAVSPEQLAEIESQLEKFESVKAEKDLRISELSKSEKRLTEENKRLHAELDKQRKAAKAAQNPLSNDIQQPIRPKATAAPIDDILSDTDWLVSPASLKGGRKDKNQSHKKDSKSDNPDQMSLF